MNKRCVWNFEINMDTSLQLPNTEDSSISANRWESRFFWPDDAIITLHGLNDEFLELSNYQIKHRQDAYYLLPNADYNLKVRNDNLFYKPLLIKNPLAIAYGKKIKLEESPLNTALPGCTEKDAHALIECIKKHGVKMDVEKEALIYRFETTPVTKLELAWLHVADKAYFSVSIESYSMLLVESFTKQLLRDGVASDYVSFLKGIPT